MNLRLIGATTVLNAIGAVGLQLLALVFLDPADYGWFSTPYLLGAFFLSLQLSVVSEAWARTIREQSTESDWSDYSTSSLVLALIGGAGASGLSILIPELRPLWWASFIAVSATVYRSSARFYSLRKADWAGVIWGDAVAAFLTLAMIPIFLVTEKAQLATVFTAWAAISLASAVASRWPRLSGQPRSRTHWIRDHRKSIAPLLRDSLIMDLSSIGTPYALMPMLGIADFGVYRAVSNVAAPVRLVLNPLRPRLSTMSPRNIRSGKLLGAVAAVSCFMGVAAGVVLLLLDLTGLKIGTLTALSVFALPVGVFVAANFFGHAFYLLARQFVSGSFLLWARLIQTATAVVLPLTGALVIGLSGAIWGYAIATSISAASWTIVTRLGVRRSD